ncbi:MAG TPA: serine hydrolase [Gemmatimonadaceae bacterium]|nr:serine hydrolase [Gemmatimonadaceae bacterium]
MLFRLIPALTIAIAHASGGGLPMKSPHAVGMSSERLEKIDHVIERGIAAGGYPGAAVVVGRRGAAVWEKAFGRLSWENSSPSVDADNTIYDLASLTKVVGTTTALMVLYDEGKIHLDDPVSLYIPEFSGGAKDRVTLRMLLEHRSGLPAGRDLWRTAHSPEEARAQVISTPLGCEPGRCYEYSDLGADMLGFVVEAVSGERLDQFLQERVFGPLGMTDTFFRPADSLKARVAPTEDHPPRGYPLQGEVHDENAFALGGVAGHAGLFSTANDLSVFAQMMLDGGEFNGQRIIADSTIALFTKRAAGTRALGWDTCGGSGSCGQYLGENAYGHTGFTGTSLWIDPEREMFVVLLTNRVHDARAKRPAKVIADVRADLADAAALAVTDYPDGPMVMPASFRADKAVDWQKPERRARTHAAVHKKKSPASSSTRSKTSPSKSSASKSSKSTTAKSGTSKSTKAASTKSASGKTSASKSAAKASSASANSAKP